jgi:hypothetical protein
MSLANTEHYVASSSLVCFGLPYAAGSIRNFESQRREFMGQSGLMSNVYEPRISISLVSAAGGARQRPRNCR